jgi:TonB family protein
LSQAARKTAAADLNLPATPPSGSRSAKLAAFLLTLDDALWPQIGPPLEGECTLRQVDSLGELEGLIVPGQTGVLLWDARDSDDGPGDLARLRGLSSAFAIIVLDAASNAALWKEALLTAKVSSVLSVPVEREILSDAFTRARAAALSHESSPVSASNWTPPPPRRVPWRPLLAALAVIVALGGVYYGYRTLTSPAEQPTAAGPGATHAQKSAGETGAAAGASTPTTSTPSASTSAPGSGTPPAGSEHAADDQVDSLLEKARQAMRDRHYIDPADQNALAFYQNVLLYDPNNGEAQQGVERVAQILFARVQSDLEDKRYDLALQALETARSIRPDDPHLKDLDARIAAVRAELGPAQIQAAVTAKNFDRALELIDAAARAKAIPAPRIAQMRDEVRRLQESSDATRLIKLLATRIQQDRLLEPREDSALYYLQQARTAGASNEALQEHTAALARRVTADLHTALAQHRTTDAEALLAAARDLGVPAKTLAAAQRELSAAHESQAREHQQHVQWLETARTRIAQGSLVNPANDGALYYFNQVKTAEPGNPELPALASALLSALVSQGRAALDAKDLPRAQTLVGAAASVGSSSDLDALKSALAQQSARAAAPTVVPASSLVMVKPLHLDYPREALTSGTEGWVDLAFTVTTEGKVTDISVVDSSPHRVFDAAAKSGVARVRYRPVLFDGQPIAVKASLHVAFRLDQK